MSLLDIVFPPRCVACGELLQQPMPLCAPCHATLLPAPQPGCVRCAEPVDGEDESCPRCTASPPPFERIHAAFAFAGAMAEAIPRFKYEDRPFLAAPLVSLALPALLPALQGCEAIAPIPLHDARLRERGFDQALLLAEELARAVNLPLERRLLKRLKQTEHQVGAPRARRAENLAGAFEATRAASTLKRVVLVDDVVTTTATARDAARALREAGVEMIRVVALARAI
jgi:ComF family protein